MTMRVEYLSSDTVGQEDFFNSWAISIEKLLIRENGFFI